MKDNPNDPDSPIWTPEDFERARPAAEVLPPHLAQLLIRERPTSILMSATRGQGTLARAIRLAA